MTSGGEKKVVRLVTTLTPSDRLHRIIMDSFDETVRGILGAGVVEPFYSYLAANGVPKNDIPVKLDRLCIVLDETFGLGSITLQRALAKRIYAKLGLTFVNSERRSLVEYIKAAESSIDEE
jgi:hypothetical protein